MQIFYRTCEVYLKLVLVCFTDVRLRVVHLQVFESGIGPSPLRGTLNTSLPAIQGAKALHDRADVELRKHPHFLIVSIEKLFATIYE